MGVLAGSALLASSATNYVAELLITFCYVYMLLILSLIHI